MLDIERPTKLRSRIVRTANLVEPRCSVVTGLAVLLVALVCVPEVRAVRPAADSPTREHLVVWGEATLRNGSVDIACHGYEEFSCNVQLRFEIEAGASSARILILETSRWLFIDPPRLTVNGREVAARYGLRAHERVAVEMSYRTSPIDMRPMRSSVFGSPALSHPVDMRHIHLGEGWRFSQYPSRMEVVNIEASDVAVEGTVRVNVSSAPGVHILVERQRVAAWPHAVTSLPRIVVEGMETLAQPIVHGGPVVTLGGLIRSDAPTLFILGVGYELSFAEHFLVSAWLETDFASLQEAVLVEVASPGYAIIPSVAAGVGVVSTQLGNRDVDFGLRLRASITFWVLGFVADFDYFFASGSWNIALAGRLSI